MYIKYPHSFRRKAQLLSLGALCLVTSFSIGIQSAGELQPFTLIEAGSVQLAGDVDGSGIVDLQDAIAILEIAQGYRMASPQELLTDPNGDGQFTVDDALRILSTL